MSILRGPTDADNFTIIANRVIRDQRLSFRARGVLVYLLSMPPGWRPDQLPLIAQRLSGEAA